MQSLRVGHDDDEDSHPHNDCFVAVSSPPQLLISEQNDWHHHHTSSSSYSSDVVVEGDEQSSLRPTSLHISIPPHNELLRPINNEEEANNNACHQRPPRRLTPVTVQSQSNTTEEQHCNNDNGANTLTSNTQNTYHRRTDDISVGFFTTQTLDEIHVTNDDDDDVDGGNNTPRSRDDNQQQQHDNVDNNNSNHQRAFHTPSINRVRLDSDSFRQTIKVVTCEKRRISDESDVSPIDSDAGFSPIMLDSTRHRRVDASENLSPLAHDGDVNNSQKRLLFDDGGDSSNDHHQQQLSPLSEFGMSVMKSLQSIIQGGGVSGILGSPSNDKENKVPLKRKHHKISSPLSSNINEQPPWNDTFLPKSSTFLKALRRSGRRGKVLIQGWVAFRCQDDISWEDIIHNPKRCDFRYIILLDDMPILHLFTSRPRRHKKKGKPDLFKDCLSIDLSGNDDVAVKINFVSKELGNEVCISNQDDMTNEHDDKYSYSLLPISIPQNIFLDKHQSRLAKGRVLECIFEPELVVADRRRVSFNSDDGLLMLEKSSKSQAHRVDLSEQYDVARHLLFVIDATIFKSQ